MKLKIITVFFSLFFLSISAQDKKAVAKVYFKKALENYADKDLVKTEEYLDKTKNYYEGIGTEEVAVFGSKFFIEIKNYTKAKEYLAGFFQLNRNKTSKNYQDMLLLYTDVLDATNNPEMFTEEVEEPVTVKEIVLAVKDTIKEVIEKEEFKIVETTETIKDSIQTPIVITLPKEKIEESLSEEAIDSAFNTEVEVLDEVSFMIVETAPIYPGCSGTKIELKKCFSTSVQTHISKNFNASIANTLGLVAGVKRVFMNFTISKEGVIKDISAKAPHPKIKEEVIRVMSLLPVMKPATQGGKNININYSIPFSLIVE